MPVNNFPSADVVKNLLEKIRGWKADEYVSVRWDETLPCKFVFM